MAVITANPIRNRPTNPEERWEGDRVGRRSFELSTYVCDGTISSVAQIAQVVGSGARRPTRSPSHGLLLFDVDSLVRITARAEALLGPS